MLEGTFRAESPGPMGTFRAESPGQMRVQMRVASSRPRNSTSPSCTQCSRSPASAARTVGSLATARPGMVLGELGEAGGLVHRVADDRVLQPAGRADLPGPHPAAGHPDADVHLARGTDGVADAAGRPERGGRGVVVVGGRAEDAERGVALELVHQATVGLDHVDDDLEEAVEQADHLLGPGAPHQRRRAGDVDEQRGDGALLPAQRDPGGQRPVGHRRPDVPAEQVAHPLPLGEPGGHRVDALLEQADLAGVVDDDADVVARRGPPGRPPPAGRAAAARRRGR